MKVKEIIIESLLSEAPSDDLIAALRDLGAEDFKQKSSGVVHLFVPQSQRKAAMKYLLDKWPEAKYNPSMSGSSLGGIEYLGGKLIIKPFGKQGDLRGGVDNEIELVKLIQGHIDDNGSVNVEFRAADDKTIEIKDCDQVVSVGGDVKDRKKADVILFSKDSGTPISIKKLNAEVWESADSYYGGQAKEIIEKLVKENKVELIPTGLQNQNGDDIMKLSKEIAVEPSEEEIMDVIFGSDIAPKGGIVIQTFMDDHFKYNEEENKLTIDAESIIKSKNDIPNSHMMVWLFRNDSTRRNPKNGIPGIRITASMFTRAFGKNGNKDVLYVNKEGKILESPGQKAEKKERKEVALAKLADIKVNDIARGNSRVDIKSADKLDRIKKLAGTDDAAGRGRR